MINYDVQMREEYERGVAQNNRLFELAQHNGYATETYWNGRLLCWPVPVQLREVMPFHVAVLAQREDWA
jgi:hypothetical protein